MSSSPEELCRLWLSRQGVTLAPERAEALARTLAAQVEAERAATRTLEFELEPAAFMRRLEGGSR